LSRGSLSQAKVEVLYEKLNAMFAQLTDDGHFVDRDAFLLANKEYHATVVGLADNEHLNAGFESLKLRQLYRAALKDTHVAVENVVYFHEYLTDSLAASDAKGAMQTILSWGKNTAARARRILAVGQEGGVVDELRPGGIIEDLSIGFAKDQDSLAGDVDALVEALDARAAIEIGITQSLGAALNVEAQREALVGRLRAFTPLVRGRGSAQVARYIRADDAFHRIFLSILRNPCLFEIYNAMDLPELMRRVLEVAPPSIREVFDDHKGLTNALKQGDANAVSAAISAHANRVKLALSDFLKEAEGKETGGLAAAS
jgi:DNA-binding GntR family transcriptional regulator